MNVKNLKKKLVKKMYRERTQPEWRKDKGFLEKKHDYKLRSKNYKEKQEKLQKFQKIAELRNPEEFYFKMQSTKIDRQNKVVLKEDEGFDQEEFQTLLKTQSLGILKMKTKSLRNQIERMKAEFQLKDSNKLKVIDLETGKEENNQLQLSETHRKTYAKINNMEHWLKELEKMMLKVDKEKLLMSKDPKKKTQPNEKNIRFFIERKK